MRRSHTTAQVTTCCGRPVHTLATWDPTALGLPVGS